ncbi:stage II sporulation protein M [Streptomonospora wellingtoniae]|uniref:Stage II sporulation protein M n=1 Tax=Streptomonospora wellingtoniae TaxID=3075544 RepID=A0ABU2L0N8_9ACTN|nr:stage II sporulation protein M [Streptomonospora sp. DSM 45055]MDT0304976.1 stage II sporulation protein M [Streptomonospora sp. DSM 45055]
MRILRMPFQIIRANVRAYLVMNAIAYGVFLIGVGAALLFPELNAAQVGSQREDGTADLVGTLLGNPWLFGLTIFAVNVLTVAALRILLPSMVVPFAGIAAFAYKAYETGVILAPVDATAAKLMIPHSLTLVIEFQAYALVMLGSYLFGKAWLRPATVGADNRRQGYLRGLKQTGWLGLPALALFVLGAAYEAVELVYLVPPLVAG